jgi:peptidyl-tRNA hydrolase
MCRDLQPDSFEFVEAQPARKFEIRLAMGVLQTRLVLSASLNGLRDISAKCGGKTRSRNGVGIKSREQIL